MADDVKEPSTNPIKFATELTIAWLNNPNSQAGSEDVPAFLEKMLAKIHALTGHAGSSQETVEHKPAVAVRASVKPDYIVSLIDGRKLKSLKRHLASHGLSPKEYRERYGLKPDYPMVAPNYSAVRRAVAEKLGLGRKVVSKTASPAKAAAPAKAKAATPAKAPAPAAASPAPASAAQKAAPAKRTPAKAATPVKAPAKAAAAKSAAAKTSTAKAPAKSATPAAAKAKPAKSGATKPKAAKPAGEKAATNKKKPESASNS